jgi:hypothetical protein
MRWNCVSVRPISRQFRTLLVEVEADQYFAVAFADAVENPQGHQFVLMFNGIATKFAVLSNSTLINEIF